MKYIASADPADVSAAEEELAELEEAYADIERDYKELERAMQDAHVLWERVLSALPPSMLADPRMGQIVGALTETLSNLSNDEYQAARQRLAERGL